MREEERLLRKQQMYDDLDTLQADDDAPDTGRKTSNSKWKVSKNEKPIAVERPTAARTFARSLSDSTVSAKAQNKVIPDVLLPPSSTDPLRRTQNQLASLPTLRKTVSDFPKASAASKLNGKRKRDSFILQVPEEQRVFRNLHIFFFPNNDVHPARRMRIAKAVEHGAVWEKDWSARVSHVVLDNTMDLNHLHTFLGLEQLPDRVIVVTEQYAAECLCFKTLLDPLQARFAVKGHLPAGLKKADSTDSDASLQLKPAGKDVQVRQVKTPSMERPVEAVPATIVSTAEDAEDDAEDDAEESDRVPNTSGVPVDNDLDDAIKKARELQHVPLDDEEGEDASGRPATSEGMVSGDEEPKTGLKLLPKKKSKYHRVQDKFQCMQKHTGDRSETENSAVINILQQMAVYYGQMGDEWRIRAYRNAISSLRNHPVKVTTREQALALPNIGERLATKIEEIAFTNRLRRLDNAKAEPNDQVLQTFMGVYGAGLVQASRWVSEGYTTLDGLLQKAKLTQNQRIGIEHYTDFNSRIPREEVAEHGAVVRKALQEIDPAFEVIIGGSYRR